MKSTDIALIAGAHGWNQDGFFEVGTDNYTPDRYYDDSKYQGLMATRDGDEWHLTDAGAFRVLVESKMYRFGNDQDPTVNPWECEWWTWQPEDVHTVANADPHTAVAIARLAQLREE